MTERQKCDFHRNWDKIVMMYEYEMKTVKMYILYDSHINSALLYEQAVRVTRFKCGYESIKLCFITNCLKTLEGLCGMLCVSVTSSFFNVTWV